MYAITSTMTMGDTMNAAIALVGVVFACLFTASTASAQAPPQLSKDQRTLLQAIVQAVDAAGNQAPVADESWPAHVLRASDGSHYVAFALEPSGDMKLPANPVLLYVRLATAPSGAATTMTERSAIRDWLGGQRVDPRMLPGRGIAIGEMPAFGAGGIGVRGSTPSTGSMDLKLMAMERERARQEQDLRDKQRRAELEGKTATVRDLLPFEDFDIASASVASDGTRQITRAFTAGPGDYHLFVAWANPAAAKPATTIHVVKRALTLPAATTTELTLSSVIVADGLTTRALPYSPAEQSSHPYTLGVTEIIPARDNVFTRDEQLAVAFQVINAQPSGTGKPDIGVTFRIVRVEGDREVPVASLNPQSYTEASLPPDFDLRVGHPLLVAMGVPLATVPRGSYRLRIAVNDRLAGRTRIADAAFNVAGTPLSLLGEAPSLGRPFHRDDAIADAMLTAIVQGLTPPAASPALRRALDLAAGRKFIDLLAEEVVTQSEQAARAALTGLALYTIGDASALTQFQRAYALGAPGGPVQFLTGAVRATQARDADAIIAWQSAMDEGWTPTAPFLIDAYLRRGDGARASALVSAAMAGRSDDSRWARALGATHLAMGRHQEALHVLDARLIQVPNDADVAWLRLQALYARIVKDGQADHTRFRTAAEAYIAAGGPHAGLASEWMRALPKGE